VAKLTLSVDEQVIEKAKRYASERGVSVSELVEAYLSAVTSSAGDAPDPPVLRALRGILKHGTRDDYRKHLEKKYL
jgi:hypothetical protein